MLKLGLSGAMFAGLFMAILGFYQYSSSGMEVARVELQPGVVNRGEIELTPDMNALRALVATGFTNSSTSMHVTHYDYRFELADRAGVVVMKEENSHFESRKETPSLHKRRSTQRTTHILDSWQIDRTDTYYWTAVVKNRKARVKSAAVIIKQNVMAKFPTTVPLGAVLMVVSFLLLLVFGKTQKPEK